MIIKIAGTSVDFAQGSLDIDDAIGARSTASFSIFDRAGDKSFAKGQPVQIFQAQDVLPDLNTWALHANALSTGTDVITLNATADFQDSISGFISCNPGEMFSFFFEIGMYVIWFFDASQQFVSSYNGGNLIPNETDFIIPSNVKYLKAVATNGSLRGSVTFKNPSLLRQEGVKVFEGYIDRPISKYLSLAGNAKIHQIDCVDNLYISDKRIVAKVYTTTLAGTIVKDIITNFLAVDGVTPGTIQDGPVIQEAVFNYVDATRSFERLAELAGFEFNIDKNKQVQFFHRATNYNNTVITENSDIKNVVVEPVAEDYRNKQYIRAGMDTTDVQTETKKGDGAAKVFTVGYPVAKVPTITLNGTAQSVGIRGVDEGKQWYWNKGEKEITQDDSGTALTSTQTLTIKYQGLFNIVVVSYDNAEIERLKGIDGTSGIVESVIDDPYITDRQTAFDDAAAKLVRYAKVGRKITFDTKIVGLDPGQLIRVILPSYGIDDYYLIESSKASELGTDDGRLIYSISIVDGSATGGWANFFKKMANRGEAYVIRENIQENEVISTIEYFNKTWNQTEIPNIYKKIYPGATTFPGANTIASFEDNDRVKYLAFYLNSIELFRKPITKTTVAGTQILTTTYISPMDANTTFTHVGWVGGSSANSNAGTGVIVDKQPFSKIKTNLETIQIDKTDTKGW